MIVKFNNIDILVYNLLKEKKTINFDEIVSNLNLDSDSVRHSLELLKLEAIISEKVNETSIYYLTEIGKAALKKGFIEEIFCNYIKNKNILMSSLKTLKIKGLLDNEIPLAFGISKRLNLVIIDSGKIIVDLNYISKIKPLKEDLKKILTSSKEVSTEIVSDFLQRKFISKKVILNKTYLFLTEKEYVIDKDTIINLTSEILKKSNFKNLKFKEYEVSKLPKAAEIGRVHPLRMIMGYIKDLYLEMGFKEMTGPYVDVSFWPMDSMFISQDHPMRDMQDTFYLPLKGKLPKSRSFLQKIKAVHETGSKTGSTGHQYIWDEEISKNLILRTHTTSVTFRTFYNLTKEEKKNSKYFCVGKVFRNESIDSIHLAEFYQAEGFVIGKNIGLSDLIGFIKKFLSKLGITKIKIKPTYNPYTEPSVEVYAYFEKFKGYREIMNSGVFRKETLEPYGIKNNVIAWGIGIERIGMLLLDKGNIKEVFGDDCDIEYLRNYIIPKRKFE
jgi:phenylalanyl-tRNA synthetase alpha chain